MDTIKVIDKNGNEVGKVEVAEKLTKIHGNPQLLHDVAVGYLRNLRQGTASTLKKGEVAASGSKPWRQKGTGRARVGSRGSPLWRGGGIIFGPKPRNYRRKIPRGMRRLALTSTVAAKLREGNVIVVDKIEADAPKTKVMAKWLANIGAGRKPLIVLGDGDKGMARLLRNIEGVSLVTPGGLNAHFLLAHGKLVISRGDFEALQERLL